MKKQRNPDVELARLVLRAIDQLGGFFKSTEHQGKDIAVARVSTAVLGAYTRAQQTRSAERTTLFMVAREMATDKEQLRRYIALTMPDAGTLMALPTATALAEENLELKNEASTLRKQRDQALVAEAENKDALLKIGD